MLYQLSYTPTSAESGAYTEGHGVRGKRHYRGVDTMSDGFRH